MPNMPELLAAAAEPAARTFEVSGPLVIWSFDLFGITFNLTESITVQWIVMLVLAVLFFVLGRNLKVKPEGKRQMIAELIVTFFVKNVSDNMGEKYMKYVPYIGVIFCMSLLNSLAGLFGLRSPTSDLSVILAWGLITFVLVERNKFKTGGFKGWAKSFISPVPFMLPFNIIGEFANPISQSLRHFANILAGGVIGGLIYFALTGIAWGLPAIGVPAVLSLYFDIFSSVIQAYIFIMLTMAYVLMAETD